MALLWCAATTVIVICVYVYLRVDQASTATGLITGAAGLRAMRIGRPYVEAAASTPPMMPRWPGSHHHEEIESQGKRSEFKRTSHSVLWWRTTGAQSHEQAK